MRDQHNNIGILAAAALLLSVTGLAAQENAGKRAASAASVIANPRVGTLLALSEAPKGSELKFTDEEKFWWNPDRQKVAASAQLVLHRNPFLIAAHRIYGRKMVVWGEDETPDNAAPALNIAWLDEVKDGPFPDFRLGKWKDVPHWELPDEYKVYNDALVKAHATSVEAFRQSAELNKDVTFGHMYQEPWKYRGAVVGIKGRLRRVREYDAPRLARDDEIKKIYEGWIFLDTPGAHPVCVIFTRLPAGIELSDEANARVAFYGYFFKKYRYVTGEQVVGKDGAVQNKQRDTLLLIGPTVVVEGPAGTVIITPETTQLVIVVLCVAVVVGIVVLIMSIMYRRADEKVRNEVAQIRNTKAVQFEDETGTDSPGAPDAPFTDGNDTAR